MAVIKHVQLITINCVYKLCYLQNQDQVDEEKRRRKYMSACFVFTAKMSIKNAANLFTKLSS